jgi:low temperature requirement protein LtrA
VTGPRVWQRPALRTDEEFDHHRPVSWLELFFDLVFVVVIARLAHGLTEHLDGGGALTFAVEFLAVFWAWNSFTYYTERFESDGLENRAFTFLAFLPVAGLAVFAENGLGENYAGFATAYLLARGLNQVSWLRACVHVPAFRPTGFRFAVAYLVAVALILVGGLVDGPLRVVLFTLAVLVEIVGPSFTVRHQSTLPQLSTSKFPERFGLLTMIVLGEAVADVVLELSALQDHHELHGAGIVAGVLGLGLVFGLWWIYFDFVARRSPKPIFVVALSWVYLHMITLAAITVTGVGVGVAVADTATGELTTSTRVAVVGGVVLGLCGIAALQSTLTRAHDEPTGPRTSPALKVGVAVMVGVLGLLDLGWTAGPLLTLLLAGLAIPMTYGAYVWFHARR